MHDVHALSERFEGPRARYNAFDPQVRQVFCRLEPTTVLSRAADAPAPLADVTPPAEPAANGGPAVPPVKDRQAEGIPPGE
jgi:hypothetical protein